MLDISDRLFVILFFPSFFISFGIFFHGIAALWRVSLEAQARKRR